MPAPPRSARSRRGPAAVYTVRRLDQLRMLASPIRLRLLEAFAAGPCTTKQAATALRLAPTRLYHHTRALEKAGLIRLTGTRQNRGTTEQYYVAIARELAVDPSILAPAEAGLRASVDAAANVFDTSRDELLSAMARQQRHPWPKALGPVAARIPVRATPAELTRIRRQVLRLLAQLKSRKPKRAGAGDRASGSVVLAFVPIQVSASKRPR
ncbi:MAG TPA: helix-turn-helix domain-containing protein [Gemmatimonadales bacterium]